MGTRPNSSAPRAPLARDLGANATRARCFCLLLCVIGISLLSTIFFRLQLPQTNIHLPTARASSRTRPQSRAGHPSQLRTSVWQHHGTRRAVCARISSAPAVLRHGRIERSRWQRSCQARCVARPCSESSMPACAMERCGAYRLHIMCTVGPITTSCGTSMCVKACGWRIGVGTNRPFLLVRRRALVHALGSSGTAERKVPVYTISLACALGSLKDVQLK